MIPLSLKLNIRDKNNKGFGIWLPLFLLWIIILPLLALPAPIIFLVALIMWPGGKGRLVFYSYIAIFSLIFNMSGLKLDIRSNDSTVYLNFV